MADRKNFEVKFTINAVDQATAVIQKVKANLAGASNQSGAAGGFANLKASASSLLSELSQLPFGLGGVAAAATAGVQGVLSFRNALSKIHLTISEGLMLYSRAGLNQMQLATTWQMSGRTLPIAAVNEYTAAIEKNTNFSAGAITNASKMLAVFPAVTGALMPKALQAAADLAAFKDIGIDEAAQMLGRASEGMITGLTRMGVPLSQISRDTKEFGSILNDVNRAFGGQAAAAATSYHGKLEKVDQQYTKLKKTVGELLEPLSKAFADAKLNFLEKLNEQAQTSVKGGYLEQVQTTLENIGEALNFASVGGVKLDDVLKGVVDGIKGQLPFLSMFLGYLDKTGAEAKKQEQQKPKKEEGKSHYEIENETAKSMFGLQSQASVDWKLEQTKAQGYFDALEAKAKTAYEAEKAEIWENAKNKDDAEKQIFDADLRYSEGRIARARAEHDKMLALRSADWNKQQGEIEGRFPTEGLAGEGLKQALANRSEALKELNQQRAKDQIEIEKKLTATISEELEKRYSEIQKHEETLRDLRKDMQNAQIEGSRAILEIGNKSVNEAGRVIVKQQEIVETLNLAQAALAANPKRAIELADQAKGMIASTVQDINALKQSFLDFQRNTAEGLVGIQKKGMSPLRAWQADIDLYESMMDEARAAQESGNLETAQKLAAAASQKAQGIANAPEGVSQAQAIRMASDAFVWAANLESQVRQQIIAREEANQAKALAEEERRQAIRQAGLQLQIDTTKQQIEAIHGQIDTTKTNTAAIAKLTETIERGGGNKPVPGLTPTAGASTVKQETVTSPSGEAYAPFEAGAFGMANDRGVGGPGTLNVDPTTKFVPGYYSSEENQTRIDELDKERKATGPVQSIEEQKRRQAELDKAWSEPGIITGSKVPKRETKDADQAAVAAWSDYGRAQAKRKESMSSAVNERFGAMRDNITGAAQSRLDESRQGLDGEGEGSGASKLDDFIAGLQEQFSVVKEAATMILEAAKTKESLTLNVATADGTTTYDSPFS